MFVLSNFPAKSQEFFRQGAILWPAAGAAAIDGGMKNTDNLTDLTFFMHHPERMSGSVGRAIDATEPNAAQLIEEWKGFRTMVATMVATPGKGSTPPAKRTSKHGLRTDNIRTVGAWCGSSSLADPQRDVDFALANNINRLDIVVNDHAKSRAAQPFTVRSGSSIKKLCTAAQTAGIETHLMSWIMPHAAYIDQAAELLIPICEDVGASSLQWDAEEPWMLAEKSMKYEDASKRIADKFSRLACPMGANAIGFTSIAKMGPLAKICDYVVPQAYSTASSGVTPGDGQRRIFERYEKAFNRNIVMGLAAFRQSGIPGHTIESAMTACVNAANDLECDTVLYWSLRQIRSSKEVRNVVRSILA